MPKYIKILAVFFVLLISGCATFNPAPVNAISYSQRAQVKHNENVRVRVSVLSNAESSAIFGVDLGEKKIQAVWVEVQNNDNHPYWLISSALDPEYFSSGEVAYSNHRFLQSSYNDQIDTFFDKQRFSNPITPKSTHSGFIFVNLDEDEKEVDIDLISKHETKFFNFFFHITGLKTHTLVEAESVNTNKQKTNLTEQELRIQLAALPCCTTSQDGSVNGDPINLVLIGDSSLLFPPFVRRGWHQSEDSYFGSIWKTINSFLFGKAYRYSPVSALYYQGRKQDTALQKARGSIHQRNHLRLWLTALKYNNKEVWVGQISRDIGIKLTTHTPSLTTHKIDPDIDEARTAFIEDMLFSQGLKTLGFVKGVGLSTKESAHQNLTGDHYVTDGLRAVLEFGRRPSNVEDVRFFDWAVPPHRSLFEK